MNRADLEELLPLLAAGALEPEEKAAATAALLGHPDLGPVLESYRSLDAVLRKELAPPPQVHVHRQCPYCKDEIGREAHVLCARCLTPHHRACFSEHRGCSLMGCEGTRAVSAEEPTLDTCPSCGEHTPTGAPYCAWCRAPLGGARIPRRSSESPRRQSWTRFAASVAALLVAGMGVGWFFEQRQNVLMRAVATANEKAFVERCESEAREALHRVAAVQQRFSSDGQVFSGPVFDATGVLRPRRPFAGSLEELSAYLRFGDLPHHFDPRGYELEVHRSAVFPTERWYAIARPRGRLLGAIYSDAEVEETWRARDARRTFFVNQTGEVQVLAHGGGYVEAGFTRVAHGPPLEVDADRCELVPAGGKR